MNFSNNLSVLHQHYGITHHGHYTSVIKKGAIWYHCNDNQIKQTNLNQEINDAYILFYKL